jgi:hypothetical protein
MAKADAAFLLFVHDVNVVAINQLTLRDISFSSLVIPSLSGHGSIAVVITIPSSVLE